MHVREHVAARGTSWYVTEEKDAQDLVDDAVDGLRKQGIEASGAVTHATQGRVAETIWDQAEGFGADLVILRSHGRSALGGVLLGSVAYRVIHHARGPVLVAR